MKKLLILFLILTLTLSLAISFVGCSTPLENITVYVPDGGPALGMAYLMKEYPVIDGVKVEYHIVSDTAELTAAQQIVAAVTNGDADVAIMPTNLAAKLYNAGKEIVLVGTNSNGLLYLLSDAYDEATFTLDALKGQVVHMVGQGGTPEAVLRKILAANDIECVVATMQDDVPVSTEGKVSLYYSTGPAVIAGLAAGTVHFAVLGEPAVSTALQKAAAKNVDIAADLQTLWKDATDSSEVGYPQTSLVVKKSLLENENELIVKIAKYTINGAVALENDATEYVNYLREEMKSTQVPPTLKQEGVLRANINPDFGEKAKEKVNAYLAVLKDFDSTLIGGKLPDDAFFYVDNGVLTTYRSVTKVFG